MTDTLSRLIVLFGNLAPPRLPKDLGGVVIVRGAQQDREPDRLCQERRRAVVAAREPVWQPACDHEGLTARVPELDRLSVPLPSSGQDPSPRLAEPVEDREEEPAHEEREDRCRADDPVQCRGQRVKEAISATATTARLIAEVTSTTLIVLASSGRCTMRESET